MITPSDNRVRLPAGAALLVIGHPGHELRVHHWLELSRPLTCVLTHGDGANRATRLESTQRVLAATGALRGDIFGPLTDRELYEAVLGGQHGVFLSLMGELASTLVAIDAAYVVCDADEGYNPAHDICSYVAEAAARYASGVVKRAIPIYHVSMVGRPDACLGAAQRNAIRIELDDEALLRKMAAAAGYAQMQDEVEKAIAAYGTAAFRIEMLQPPTRAWRDPAAPPFYESFGEQQVAAGRYARVIRYEEHLRPLAEALLAHAGVAAGS